MRKSAVVAIAMQVVVMGLLACGLAFGQSEIERLTPRAEHGEVAAQLALARAYFLGNGVPKDEAAAALWFRKAADQGEVHAESILGSMYEKGRGGLPKDDAQAVYWYRKAAEQGLAASQGSLGWMYEQGRGGLPKDEAQAAAWYRKAAEQGWVEAEGNLGAMYDQGRGGLPKDEAQAIYWYRKAAAQGNAVAQSNLALIYVTSSNPEIRNPSAALDYARKAVSSNQYNPGFLGTLAEVYYVEGQYDDAVRTAQQAITVAPAERKSVFQARLDKYRHALEESKRALDGKNPPQLGAPVNIPTTMPPSR